MRATIGLHPRSKKSLYNLDMIVDDSSKRELLQTPGLLYVVLKGPPLDWLWASDHRFFG